MLQATIRLERVSASSAHFNPSSKDAGKTLMATSRLSLVSVARYTSPIPLRRADQGFRMLQGWCARLKSHQVELPSGRISEHWSREQEHHSVARAVSSGLDLAFSVCAWSAKRGARQARGYVGIPGSGSDTPLPDLRESRNHLDLVYTLRRTD